MMFAALLMTALALVPADVQKDVTYRTVDGQELKLDFYPARDAGTAPAPLVIVVHGGAWVMGQRSDMAQLCEQISQQGMAAATVSYRLAPRSKWPAMIDDVQSAVRYMRANADKYGIDPKRVGSAGASAGGHLALLLGFSDTRDKATDFLADQSSRVSVVFNIFGPTDMTQDFNPQLANVVSMQVLGKPMADAASDMKSLSPVNFVDKESAPVFTVHGTADAVVPVKQAERLDVALKAAGIDHQLEIVDGMGHGFDATDPAQVKAFSDGIAFLKKHLTP